jgi:hypothetical protein
MTNASRPAPPAGFAYFDREEAFAGSQLFYAWFTFVVGLVVFTANSLFLSVILFNRRFRTQREYVVLGANMFFDALYGLNFFLSAVWTLKIYYFEGECKLSETRIAFPPNANRDSRFSVVLS